MTLKELLKELLNAYQTENLNRIALTLINLFRSRQFSILRRIAEIIADCVEIEIKEDGKGFNRFMMLYHPDRASYHISQIHKLADQNNYDGLLNYAHILKLERIDEIAASIDTFEDVDYEPVYEWDFNLEGFRTFYDSDKVVFRVSKSKGCNFYDAIKIRQYGDTEIEFSPYYLEDFEEFELADSDINDLDGVQYCIHAKTIDISENRISDLSFLSGLKNLEDLNLSGNEIGYIDPLCFLKKLKSLDLSNNCVDDISPLMNLECLEYVNLSGNNVSKAQITELLNTGITVDY